MYETFKKYLTSFININTFGTMLLLNPTKNEVIGVVTSAPLTNNNTTTKPACKDKEHQWMNI